MYAGVLARNNVEETSNAIENEEYRMVDEKEAVASGVQASSAQLWAAAMGRNAWSWWVPDDT